MRELTEEEKIQIKEVHSKYYLSEKELVYYPFM